MHAITQIEQKQKDAHKQAQSPLATSHPMLNNNRRGKNENSLSARAICNNTNPTDIVECVCYFECKPIAMNIFGLRTIFFVLESLINI